jgi:hypothetical protein
MDPETLVILKDIQSRLDSIEKRLGEVEKGCTKMGNHINFVECVYEMVKRTITWSQKLPELTDKE